MVPLERLRDDLQEHLMDRKQVGGLTGGRRARGAASMIVCADLLHCALS